MTATHSEQSLRDKIAELEIANGMLTDFAALVSHDIRSALRRTISYAELLRVMPALNGDPDAPGCVQMMIVSTRRIRVLADGALASPPQPPLTLQNESDTSVNPALSSSEDGETLERQLNELKRSNRELTDFADSVARGLRTPLEQILDAARNLITLPVVATNPVSLDMVMQILASAKQMQRLVDDYLTFANAERHAIYRCRISLESLVQLVRHELEPMAMGRKVTWQIGPLPEVDADVSMLRQALVNLLSNSLKFTYQCPEAIIEIGARLNPGEHIIYIRDNGIGFDLESARNLFQKFVRLQDNGMVPGVGIGLVIVKHIIQRHRGRVWAEAAPGGGAKFFFTLPVATQEKPPKTR